MRSVRDAGWGLVVFSFVFSTGCTNQPTADDQKLTSSEAVEREVVITGQVFVDSDSPSPSTIKNAVKRQVRTAFGPLRIAKISVDDRELASNVDPATFVKRAVEVVRIEQPGPDAPDDAEPTVVVVKTVTRVDYTYRARALVNKQHDQVESVWLALLMGNYQGFVNDIIHDCVEDYEHDSEFSTSFWYVFAPGEYACKQRIEKESEAVAQARVGLEANQIPEVEMNRRFLPMAVQLITPDATAPTTYPEYHRLYGVGSDAQPKEKIGVYMIFGIASHAGDPENERFEHDAGFAEFFKTIDVLTDSFEKLTIGASFNPLQLTFEEQSYTAKDLGELQRWVLYGQNLPEGIADDSDKSKAFRRAIHDHLYRNWFALEVPLLVVDESSTDAKPQQRMLQINLVFGTNSDWDSRNFFRHAFKQGDVVVYDGHSYIGSGPLDPSNYSPSSFRDDYQIFFFNSCVSFNYYSVDYFDHKADGSQNLDLVTNGIESYIYDGGKSMGQFVASLFDNNFNSWLQVLNKTRIPWYWSGYHDPNRAVDGELDNVYDPATMQLSVTEGTVDPDDPDDPEPEPLFFDDGEGGDSAPQWTMTGMWHQVSDSSCAAPAYASAQTAWYFGDDSSCSFDDDRQVQGTLTSPAIAAISDSSTLSFASFRDVESTDSGSYDETSVEVAIDGSDEWKTIWSRTSKDASARAWTAADPISLSQWAGETIRVRFRFDSKDGYSNNFVGWLIDDVLVTP